MSSGNRSYTTYQLYSNTVKARNYYSQILKLSVYYNCINGYNLNLTYKFEDIKILFPVVMGLLIPNLEHFISFVGAVTLSILALFFPAFIETSTYWYQKSGWDFFWMMFRNFLITIFALLGLIVGGFTSIQSIIHSLGEGAP